MLTKKQYEILSYLKQKIAENGVCPSYDEMRSALKLRSKSGIHRLITALEERGFIRKLPKKARALEIIRDPEEMAKKNTDESNLKVAAETPAPGKDSKEEDNYKEIPLYGFVAAGTPIEALRNETESISIPPTMIKQGNHFALKVSGDSMLDAGILDGDVAIIKSCEEANNGDVVIALIDQEEATLKKIRKYQNSIALEPANKSYKTQIYNPKRIKIQGRLVGLMRKY